MLGVCNVRQVCDDRIELFFPERFKQRPLKKTDICERLFHAVPLGPAECFPGQFRAPYFKVGTLRSECERNCAGTGSQFADACAVFQISAEQIRQHLRLRTRNQGSPPNLQIQKTKLRPSENILERFICKTTRQKTAPFPYFALRQPALSVERKLNIRNRGDFRYDVGAFKFRRFKPVAFEFRFKLFLKIFQIHSSRT